MFNKFTKLICFALIQLTAHAEHITQKSSTGSSIPYLETCKNAAINEAVFQNFRSIEAYFNAVECGQTGEFAQYIRNHATQKTLSLIPQFNFLDHFGNPTRNMIDGFGLFSGTTLRYVLFADHISRIFDLPPNCKIAEIGAGFGGQAYVLSKLVSFSDYYIYDLPEVEELIKKMTSTLAVANISCLHVHAKLPVDQVDLFISNYALSECDKATQIDYIQRVASKAKRGYMLYNDTNIHDHLKVGDFIEQFKLYGINLKVQPEPVFSYTGNILLTWDTTKQ
jgi:hypothetical protein